MTNSPEWYELVAKAFTRRDRALAGIKRWQEALAEAEMEIADLTATTAELVQVNGPEQVQE